MAIKIKGVKAITDSREGEFHNSVTIEGGDDPRLIIGPENGSTESYTIRNANSKIEFGHHDGSNNWDIMSLYEDGSIENEGSIVADSDILSKRYITSEYGGAAQLTIADDGGATSIEHSDPAMITTEGENTLLVAGQSGSLNLRPYNGWIKMGHLSGGSLADPNGSGAKVISPDGSHNLLPYRGSSINGTAGFIHCSDGMMVGNTSNGGNPGKYYCLEPRIKMLVPWDQGNYNTNQLNDGVIGGYYEFGHAMENWPFLAAAFGYAWQGLGAVAADNSSTKAYYTGSNNNTYWGSWDTAVNIATHRISLIEMENWDSTNIQNIICW